MCMCVQINPREEEALLSQLPCPFSEKLFGVWVSLVKHWNFWRFCCIKNRRQQGDNAAQTLGEYLKYEGKSDLDLDKGTNYLVQLSNKGELSCLGTLAQWQIYKFLWWGKLLAASLWRPSGGYFPLSLFCCPFYLLMRIKSLQRANLSRAA